MSNARDTDYLAGRIRSGTNKRQQLVRGTRDEAAINEPRLTTTPRTMPPRKPSEHQQSRSFYANSEPAQSTALAEPSTTPVRERPANLIRHREPRN